MEAEELVGASALVGDEDQTLGGFTPGRLLEFATGRDCAHRAIKVLGGSDLAVPVGEGREPLWPDGFVGSISHCPGYVAAAVAVSTEFRSVGIDVEKLGQDVGISDIALTKREMKLVEDRRRSFPEVEWEIVLFSIKEAIFKTWFPLQGRWLDYTDAEVWIDLQKSSFVADLSPDPPSESFPPRVHGAWAINAGFVAAALALPSEGTATGQAGR